MLEDLPPQYGGLGSVEDWKAARADDGRVHAPSFVRAILHALDEHVQVC